MIISSFPLGDVTYLAKKTYYYSYNQHYFRK